MENFYRRNWLLLREKTTNIDSILAELYSREIISRDEQELIKNEYVNKTTNERADALYTLLERKDFRKSEFQEILSKTCNTHIVDELCSLSQLEKTEFGLFWRVPERNKNEIIGRDSEILEIWNEISKNDLKLNTCKIILKGMVGVGKSWIVNEFIYRYRSQFKNFIWFDGHESDIGLPEQIIQLGKKLKFYSKKIDFKNLPKFLEHFKENWFENNHNSKWLIVFDNFDDKDLDFFANFIPRYGGCIIMTTRIMSEFSSFFQIPVKNLDPKYGKKLVLKILKNENGNNIQKLCSELDYNPMCITNTCHFIQDTKLDLKKYLNFFDKYAKQVFLSANRTPNELSIYLNFKITFEKLEKENPIAFKWLQISSYIHPYEIPTILISEYLGLIQEFGVNPQSPSSQFWSKIKNKLRRKKPCIEIELEILELQKIIHKYGLFKIENANNSLLMTNIVQKSVEIFNQERMDESSHYFYKILKKTWLNKLEININWLNCPDNLVSKLANFQIVLKELDKISNLKQEIFLQIAKNMRGNLKFSNSCDLTLVTDFGMFIEYDECDSEFIGYFDLYDSKVLNLFLITDFCGKICIFLRKYKDKEEKLTPFDFDYSDTIDFVLGKISRLEKISVKDHYFFKIKNRKTYLKSGQLVRDILKQFDIIDYQPKSDKEKRVQILVSFKTQFFIQAKASDRIVQLMDQLSAKLDIPVSEQRILHGGRQLLVGDILFDLCIEDTVSMQLVLRMKGGVLEPARQGFRFPNISINRRFLTRILTRDSDCTTEREPSWRIPREGLNIHGICTGEKCPARNQQVISRMGYGIFNLKFDLNKIFCPSCKGILKSITSCGFLNTFWRYLGRSELEPEKFIESAWTKCAEDEYMEFNENEKNPQKYSIKWFHLAIQTVSIENRSIDNSNSPLDQICSFCLEEIDGEGIENPKNCGHKCHSSCSRRFGKIRGLSELAKNYQICRLCNISFNYSKK